MLKIREAGGSVPLQGLEPYDMSEPFAALQKWNNTVLPLVLFQYEIYIFVGVHIFFKSLVNGGYLEDSAFSIGVEPWKMMALTTSVLSFFIIFLLNQCFTRYTTIYSSCCSIMGSLQTVGAHLNVHLGTSPDRWVAMRYLIASAELVYLKVNDGDFSNSVVDEDEWDRLCSPEEFAVVKGLPSIVSPPLLTKEEAKLIRSYQGSAPMLLQMWGMQVLRKAFMEAGASEYAFLEAQRGVFDLRDACASILNTLSMPVPFAYYHICVILIYFSYCVFTIILVPQDSNWTVVFLFVLILIISGMRQIAAAMSDPFGPDQGDLPTEKFIRDVRAHGCIIATADTRPPLNGYKPQMQVPDLLQPPSLVERVVGIVGFKPDAKKNGVSRELH